MQETLTLARQAVALGHRDAARQLLMQLARDPAGSRVGEVWHLLGQVLNDPAQRADCARRAAQLGYAPPAIPSASAASTTVTTSPPAPATPPAQLPVMPASPEARQPIPAAPEMAKDTKPALVSDRAPAAVVAPPMASAPAAKPVRARRGLWIGLGVLLVLLLVGGGAFYLLYSNGGVPNGGIQAALSNMRCKDAVRAGLSVPGSADFDMPRAITRTGTRRTIQATFHAQNFAGGTVSLVYLCTIDAGAAQPVDLKVLTQAEDQQRQLNEAYDKINEGLK